MHRSSSTRGSRIATVYCKIFSLKGKVNLLLLNVTLHQLIILIYIQPSNLLEEFYNIQSFNCDVVMT